MYEAFFSKLASCKQVMPTQWIALCPAHDDQTPSLWVEDKGNLLAFGCRAGCTKEAILAAMNLKWADTFPPKEPTMASKVVATFEYTDERGNVLYVVDRVEPGKDGRKKDFPCKRMVDGQWVYKLGDVRRVLYRLPELLKSGNRLVLIVEGERKADLLASWGFVATCSPGGAGKWRKEYGEFLDGRTVVVLPDNDEPGRNHAKQVLDMLDGYVKSGRVVELPGLGEKGDVIDWAAGGGNAEQLKALLKSPAKPQPEPPPNGHKTARLRKVMELLVTHMEKCPEFAAEVEKVLEAT